MCRKSCGASGITETVTNDIDPWKGAGGGGTVPLAKAWVTKDGKRFDLGTSRNGSGYRVLSSTGVENYINTLRHIVNTEE
jgi:hypothetical protein